MNTSNSDENLKCICAKCKHEYYANPCFQENVTWDQTNNYLLAQCPKCLSTELEYQCSQPLFKF